MALVDLLAHWNVRPNAVVGHSSGEIAAAYAKGSLSREQAWLVAYHRGGPAFKAGEQADEVLGGQRPMPAFTRLQLQQASARSFGKRHG